MPNAILAWGGGTETCHSQETIDFMKKIGPFSEFQYVSATLDPRPDIATRMNENGIWPIYDVEGRLWAGAGFSPADISWAIPQLQAIKNAGWKGFSSEGMYGPQVEVIRNVAPYADYGSEDGQSMIGGHYGHWMGQATAHYMENYYTYALNAMKETALINNQDTPNEMGLTWMLYSTASLELDINAMRSFLDWGESQGIKWKVFTFWMGEIHCPKDLLEQGRFTDLLNLVKSRYTIVKRTGWGGPPTDNFSRLSLFSTNMTPTAGQTYVVYGYLKDSLGNPLAGRSIDLWYRYEGDPVDNGKKLRTLTTDNTGKFMTELASSRFVNLRVLFNGDDAYADSRSDLVLIKPVMNTILTLQTSDATPKIGEPYYLLGTLKDGAGSPMVTRSVNVWYRHPSETLGHFWQTIQTDNKGAYQFPAASDNKVFIRTVFMGNEAYARSYSDLVTIAPHA